MVVSIYNDPIIGKRRKGDLLDPYYDISESLQVINNKAILTEIPNRFARVQVKNLNQQNLFEIHSGTPSENQFVVDYTEGVVSFHPTQNGNTFIFIYKGEGAHYFPASRIWTKKNNGNVQETLQELIEDGQQKIEEVTDKIAEVNRATIDARNATSDYTTLVNQSKKIYKPMVNNYPDIATTYPNPQIGWTVVVKNTGIEYRWNGSQWEAISIKDANGFFIHRGSNPPDNTETIWLDTSDSPAIARVIGSNTQPTDTSVIWWVLD